jgi:hypothetical protein
VRVLQLPKVLEIEMVLLVEQLIGEPRWTIEQVDPPE